MEIFVWRHNISQLLLPNCQTDECVFRQLFIITISALGELRLIVSPIQTFSNTYFFYVKKKKKYVVDFFFSYHYTIDNANFVRNQIYDFLFFFFIRKKQQRILQTGLSLAWSRTTD